MSLDDVIKAIKAFVKQMWPALALALWDFEEEKVLEAKNETLDANLNLQKEKNNEIVETKYIGRSDIDVLHDAISKGGDGQSGKSDTTNSDTKPKS